MIGYSGLNSEPPKFYTEPQNGIFLEKRVFADDIMVKMEMGSGWIKDGH